MMNMLILLYLFLIHVSCLKLRINEEMILRTPIKSESIGAGLIYLLEEGDYTGLTELLRLKRINVPKIYLNSLGTDQFQYLILALTTYIQGFMTQEDAKQIIPAKLVSYNSSLQELKETDIEELPENPLANEFIYACNLNENSLFTALKRGIREKDPSMIWTSWPIETPMHYRQVWSQAELWKVLLIESFCDGQFDVKTEFISILKSAASDPEILADELLMLNISLFSFHLEILRIKELFRSSQDDYHARDLLDFRALENLENESLNLFKVIKAKAAHGLIFDGFEAQSAEIMVKSPLDLAKNPFYYESRIEVFVSVVQRLKHLPNLFGDWFCNLYFCFNDVIPMMSLNLLSDSWNLFLSFSPTVEAICSLLTWFDGRINEDYRFRLAQEIPASLIPLFYRKCVVKNIPNPLELIPYELRESEYLKRSREGSVITFTYGLDSFWIPQQTSIVKLLKVFEHIYLGEIDLYESVDTFFTLGTTSQLIGLSRFLEILLNTFLDIKEWYMIPKKSDPTEIIPSPLLPPKLITILVQIIVRCRHLSCKLPFKISEKYLKMTLIGCSPLSKQKLVESQMKYLINSNDNRLPRLTKYYKMYFYELNRIQKQSVYDARFLRDYYNLHSEELKTLWTAADSSHNWDMTHGQLAEVETSLKESVSMGIHYFGSELNRKLGPVTFSSSEVYNFLFNS